MMIRSTSLAGIETAGFAVSALLSVALVPATAAEFSTRRDVAAPAAAELCEPARWTGKAAFVVRIADQQDTGWWVVLATVPAEQDVSAMVSDLEGCGLRPFNDFSSKFEGFRAGFQVVVDGAYATRSEAERVRSAASRCVPDAYVKWARYLGE